MIRTPTTFVVGAGASQPYGYPLGSGLYDLAKAVGPESDVYQLVRQSVVPGGDVALLNSVLQEMREESALSIDEFLLRRQDREIVQRIGKALIAILLAQAAATSVTGAREIGRDWLRRVAREMLAGASTWSDVLDGNRNLRFITFNFDSVIQQKVTLEAQRAFPSADVRQLLEAVPIVHVNGRLSPAPRTTITSNVGDVYREWMDWTARAVDEIRIVHERHDDNETEQRVSEGLLNAAVVCFLGFSYHIDNMRRLDVANDVRPNATVFGSA
ncbi:MAG TPA: hypothetical protein VLV86_23895, partial [Vicinamibacterales bacterium]|nr:hypothetical protein [Vicinamibacterales bacterium]